LIHIVPQVLVYIASVMGLSTKLSYITTFVVTDSFAKEEILKMFMVPTFFQMHQSGEADSN
jgi:hypothetical protein